jgi:purine nucleosidase
VDLLTHKLLLDCDTGVDDTMAILYAALHPDVELLGVGAVFGNVPVDVATRNSTHALAMVGRDDVPVARGAAGPLDGRPQTYAFFVHGDDGQGNAGTGRPVAPPVQESAADQIVRLVREHPGEVELVAVGPLTNLALALRRCPELPSLVRGVTLMGGAAAVPGNVTPVAEVNIWFDPEAAAAVFAARWQLTMVGLDVTMRTTLDEGHRARLAAGGSVGDYVARVLDFYFDFCADRELGERSGCMHDTLAVAVAAGSLVPTLAPMVNVRVDTSEGVGRGQTVCDLRGRYMGFPVQPGAHCAVVLETDPSFADEAVALIAAAGDSRIDVSAAGRPRAISDGRH